MHIETEKFTEASEAEGGSEVCDCASSGNTDIRERDIRRSVSVLWHKVVLHTLGFARSIEKALDTSKVMLLILACGGAIFLAAFLPIVSGIITANLAIFLIVGSTSIGVCAFLALRDEERRLRILHAFWGYLTPQKRFDDVVDELVKEYAKTKTIDEAKFMG